MWKCSLKKGGGEIDKDARIDKVNILERMINLESRV